MKREINLTEINVNDFNSFYVYSNKDILFRSVLYPIVEKALRDKKNERKLFMHIAKYRDKNVDILSSPMVLKNMFFTDSDFNIIYEITGIDEEFVDKLLEIVKPPQGMTYIPDNIIPFRVLLLIMIMYYKLNKKEKEYITLCSYYAYSMYHSIHFKFFRGIPINEDIMRYVTNSLSYKFKLKQTANLDKTLCSTVSVAIDGYEKRINRGSDSDIHYIILQLKDRLTGFMRKIKNEYTIAKDKGNIIFKEKTFDDEDNVIENTGILSDVQSYAADATTKFFSIQDADRQIISFCSKGFNVSVNELRAAIVLLAENNEINEIKEFYNSLFYLFFSNGGKKEEVKTGKFIALANDIYKKGNSNNKNIKTIKSLLDKWLKNGSQTYKSSTRPATLNSFRKAIFFYFVMIVTK